MKKIIRQYSDDGKFEDIEVECPDPTPEEISARKAKREQIMALRKSANPS